MVSNNKKRRKNNRNNKKNKIKKEKMIVQSEKPTEEQRSTDDQEIEVEHEETLSLKRSLPEDNSDAEETEGRPKKKKKKQPAPATSSGNKGKKSIRQMKKERYAQRQAEAQAASKDQLKSECLSYLSQWKNDRSNWKFMKAKQVWIYKNKFSPQLMPDNSWPVLLEYFESAKGNIRNMLLDDANKVIKQMDEWTEKQSSNVNEDKNEIEDSTEEDITKPDEISYKRARDLIQCLQE